MCNDIQIWFINSAFKDRKILIPQLITTLSFHSWAPETVLRPKMVVFSVVRTKPQQSHRSIISDNDYS